ncbi:conserved protein of unknown function [Burkholderia multivorans]
MWKKEHRECEVKLARKIKRALAQRYDGRQMGCCTVAVATRRRARTAPEVCDLREVVIRPHGADGQGRDPRLRG